MHRRKSQLGVLDGRCQLQRRRRCVNADEVVNLALVPALVAGVQAHSIHGVGSDLALQSRIPLDIEVADGLRTLAQRSEGGAINLVARVRSATQSAHCEDFCAQTYRFTRAERPMDHANFGVTLRRDDRGLAADRLWQGFAPRIDFYTGINMHGRGGAGLRARPVEGAQT
ncbi:MAG: hypothetical protein ABS96_28845 [Lysobacteraceae bacterium SCN 69-123]|nr:MAG: hypothetical protein ABS96_28845 [Xanthomonadaceae bacterium SCN 69-123]